MPGKAEEHGAAHAETGVEYNPENLRETSSSDIIEACWHGQDLPLTGEKELEENPVWDLQWRNEAREPGLDMRGRYDREMAMSFAADLAREGRERLSQMDGNHTDRAVLDYIRQNPHNWEETIPLLNLAARNVLETSQHLAYRAIMHESPEELDAARAMIQEAPEELDDVLMEGGMLHDGVMPPGLEFSGEASEEYILERQAYIDHLSHGAVNDTQREAANEFAAGLVVARDMAYLHRANLEAMRDDLRDPAVNAPSPGAQRAVHELSVWVFEEKGTGIQERVQQDLASGNVTKAEESYRSLHRMAQNIQSVARG